MSALPKRKKYTSAEYLALEEKAEYKSEYENGYIVAMAGGSLDHARITKNIDREISRNLKKACESFTTDVKVSVERYQKFYYPDVFVICGKPAFYQKRNDIVTNPVLIVEVLSKSTEANDRGEKFASYQAVETLQEYILVSQDKAKIEQFTRQNDGSWKYQATIGLKSKVDFTSIEVELSLDEVYQRVDFE